MSGDRRGDDWRYGVTLAFASAGRPASHGQGGYGARHATLPILLLDAALIMVAASQGHRRAGGSPGSGLPVPGLPPCRTCHGLRNVTAGRSLRRCQYQFAATITATFRAGWGPLDRQATFSFH